MTSHQYHHKSWMRRASVAALVMAILGGGVACKRRGTASAPGSNAPSVARAPRMSAPATQDLEQEDRAKLLASLYLMAPLGEGVAERTPDGETWTRFGIGLRIRDLRPGRWDARSPQVGQTVTISYVGMLADSDRVFDRRDAANPFTFVMGSRDVIEGLSLGLATMKEGGLRRIYVPAKLGYGAAGNPRAGIGGGQDLIFEVELLKFTGEAVYYSIDDVFPKAEPLGPPAPKSATTSATGSATASSPAPPP